MAPRRGNHRILRAGLLAAGLVVMASSADARGAAQESAGARAGLRTLSWPGKAEAPRPQQPDAASASPAAPSAPLQIQPGVLPDYTAAARPFPQSLTPATAFGSPPVVSGGQAWASTPVPYGQVAPGAPADRTSVTQTPVVQTPVRSSRTLPSPPAATRDDPMAPRPDAPIWRMDASGARAASQPAAQPAPGPGAGPDGRDGARYYSVHREAGRAPDPATLPAPFFLDSAPVDLAEPPPPPTLMRSQGGLAPSVAGDL